MNRDCDTMFIQHLPMSKSGIGLQMQMLKARKHLEDGGSIAFVNMEHSPEDWVERLSNNVHSKEAK